MALNPSLDTAKKTRNLADNLLGLSLAQVIGQPDVSTYRVPVRITTKSGEGETLSGADAPFMITTALGDVALPSKGDVVLVGRLTDETTVVLGSVYTDEDAVPADDSSERHVGADSNAGTFLHGPFGVTPRVTQDDSDAPDGAVWYRTDLDEYRGVEDGAVVSFDTTPV